MSQVLTDLTCPRITLIEQAENMLYESFSTGRELECQGQRRVLRTNVQRAVNRQPGSRAKGVYRRTAIFAIKFSQP